MGWITLLLSFLLCICSGLNFTTIGTGVDFAVNPASSRNSFVVAIACAGYGVPQDAANQWSSQIVLASTNNVRYVYSLRGPQDVLFHNLSSVNVSSVAQHLQSMSPRHIVMLAHSSGSFVCHALLNTLLPAHVAIVSYANLDGGIGDNHYNTSISCSLVKSLHHAYCMSSCTTHSTCSPNMDTMRTCPQRCNAYQYVLLSTPYSNCQATWCQHMTLINQVPHNHTGSSLLDYSDYTYPHIFQPKPLQLLSSAFQKQ